MLVFGHVPCCDPSHFHFQSDPYVLVRCGQQELRTRVCKRTLEPVWEEEMWLEVQGGQGPQVVMEVFDKDKVGKDEGMGQVCVDLRKVAELGTISRVWDSLAGCKSGRLLWSAEWHESAGGELTGENTEDTTKELTKNITKDISSAGDTMVREEETAAVPSVTKSEVVTTADIVEPEPESADPEPQNRDSEQKPEDDVIPEVDKLGYLRNGFLKVTVHKAEDLVAKDIGGSSDPYVVIRYDGQKSKSKHIKSDLNPEFEFTTGYVVEEGGASDLVIEIRDHDLGKDESLGHCSFDLRQVLGQVTVECCQSIFMKTVNIDNCRGVLRRSGAV